MALTNQMLKAMGIEQDQRDQIMTAHQEVLEAIKAERNELRDTAAKVPDLERQIEELEASKPTEDWEGKYGELKQEFEEYKSNVSKEKAEDEKKRLYRELLEDAGIQEGKHVDAILKIADLSEINVKDGEIEDSEELKKGIEKEWDAFIPKKSTEGAKTPTPPNGSASNNTADPDTVKRLKERHERLYGKIEEKE